jgi:Xaa-Pro aminopeptidase
VFRGFQKERKKFLSLEPIMSEIRLIKTREEIDFIKKAISITHEAFRAIKKILQPGMYEYEIEAEIAKVFRSHHATEAYPTIVAS